MRLNFVVDKTLLSEANYSIRRLDALISRAEAAYANSEPESPEINEASRPLYADAFSQAQLAQDYLRAFEEYEETLIAGGLPFPDQRHFSDEQKNRFLQLEGRLRSDSENLRIQAAELPVYRSARALLHSYGVIAGEVIKFQEQPALVAIANVLARELGE